MSTEYIPWPPADFMWALAFRDEQADLAATEMLYERAYEIYNYTEPVFFHDQEAEHYASQPDSIADIDRYDVELGALNRNDTTSEWILSDRDCWYRNPFFTGTPSGTHPEDEPREWDPGYDADTHEPAERSEHEDDPGYDADTHDQSPF